MMYYMYVHVWLTLCTQFVVMQVAAISPVSTFLNEVSEPICDLSRKKDTILRKVSFEKNAFK